MVECRVDGTLDGGDNSRRVLGKHTDIFIQTCAVTGPATTPAVSNVGGTDIVEELNWRTEGGDLPSKRRARS